MKKVKQFYSKNQFIIRDDNEIIFQSYDSTIAIIKNGELTLGKDWDYSKTTTKHLYLFLKEYCNSIYNLFEFKNNKRKAIQKLIDNGTINYNEML